MTGNVSTANGRSAREVAVCAVAVALEVAVAGGLVSSWSAAQAVGLSLFVGLGFLWHAKRPTGWPHVNYCAEDRHGVVQYIGKSSAFELRVVQHQHDAGERKFSPSSTTTIPKGGKDWAVILNEGGRLREFARYRNAPHALHAERRMTYSMAVAVYVANSIGCATGTLPPRVFGNRANTPYSRNGGGLRPWEWAALPMLAVAYALRPMVDGEFPRWLKWTPRSGR